MNILLRKLWILSSLMLVANAEIVFQLEDQKLQNAIGKDSNGQITGVKETPSRYNLPKVYVSTGLVQNENGTYTLGKNTWQDQFYVEVKNTISKWNVQFSTYSRFTYAIHTIKFISDTGKTITLGMHGYKTYCNSSDDYIISNFSSWTTVDGSVSMDGGEVTFKVNGKEKIISVPNFSKLKYVSISILSDGLGHPGTKSILNSLLIGSSD